MRIITSATVCKIFLVIKYGDWVRETLLDILERVDCFPRAKYWKSTQPKHIELATDIIEEIIVPINQSITEFEVEIQFEIMQLLATQICEHLLKYMKQTDYRYSTQVPHLSANLIRPIQSLLKREGYKG